MSPFIMLTALPSGQQIVIPVVDSLRIHPLSAPEMGSHVIYAANQDRAESEGYRVAETPSVVLSLIREAQDMLRGLEMPTAYPQPGELLAQQARFQELERELREARICTRYHIARADAARDDLEVARQEAAAIASEARRNASRIADETDRCFKNLHGQLKEAIREKECNELSASLWQTESQEWKSLARNAGELMKEAQSTCAIWEQTCKHEEDRQSLPSHIFHDAQLEFQIPAIDGNSQVSLRWATRREMAIAILRAAEGNLSVSDASLLETCLRRNKYLADHIGESNLEDLPEQSEQD